MISLFWQSACLKDDVVQQTVQQLASLSVQQFSDVEFAELAIKHTELNSGFAHPAASLVLVADDSVAQQANELGYQVLYLAWLNDNENIAAKVEVIASAETLFEHIRSNLNCGC